MSAEEENTQAVPASTDAEETTTNDTEPTEKKVTVDSFTDELRDITTKVGRGGDAVEFVVSFWEKMSKIEQSYADAITSLCDSRTAKLTKLFDSEPTEHVPEVLTAWDSCMSDFKKLAALRSEVAKKHKETASTLNEFATKKIPEQKQAASMSRRVVADLKSERVKAGYALLKYRKVCKDAHDQLLIHKASEGYVEGDESPAMMAAELERARESAVYKTVLDNHAKTHDQTFHTVLPGLLENIKSTEVERVHAIKDSIQAGIMAATEAAGAVVFDATNKSLSELAPESVTSCDMVQEPPRAPYFAEPTIEQLYPQGEPSADQLQGIFRPSPSTARKTDAAELPKSPAKAANELAQKAGGMFSKFWNRVTSPKAGEGGEGGEEGAGDTANGDGADGEGGAAAASDASSTPAATDGDAPKTEVAQEGLKSEEAAENLSESDDRSAAAAQAAAAMHEDPEAAPMFNEDVNVSAAPEGGDDEETF
eukprot:m.25620 g.25620  ORF g.25620 m.25620 type:complete len:481 (+) comp4253_c0_seq1:19-1461(+)